MRSATKLTLEIDAVAEIDRIAEAIRVLVGKRLRRWGVVVGLSGGIDSSVVAALCALALGSERVFGLLMPERDSAPETLPLSRSVAEAIGIPHACEDISKILESCGCYRLRDEAIRAVIPEHQPGDRSKIVLPSVTGAPGFRVFSVVVEAADGTIRHARLSPAAYRQVVAATNFKQRARKMLEYYHADRLNYAVAGTPNLLEYDQGFFVKNGDGASDLKPIAHLYKAQVYQLAEALGIPAEVRTRPPTTDTYSLPQSQAEFYFSLPYQDMDFALYAHDHAWDTADVATELELAPETVTRVFRDIEAKRRVAEYLRAPPLCVADAKEQ